LLSGPLTMTANSAGVCARKSAILAPNTCQPARREAPGIRFGSRSPCTAPELAGFCGGVI
jgi:hypothetical protein